MKPEELLQTITRMIKDTTDGNLNWKLDIQTTEGNSSKYTVEEEGETWVVDECYVCYVCNYRGNDFCMITYEMIKKSKDLVRTVNYVFLPPIGVRLFSLHTLLPHSIEAGQVLVSRVHSLWTLLMQIAKKNTGQVKLSITEASVSIEEETAPLEAVEVEE